MKIHLLGACASRDQCRVSSGTLPARAHPRGVCIFALLFDNARNGMRSKTTAKFTQRKLVSIFLYFHIYRCYDHVPLRSDYQWKFALGMNKLLRRINKGMYLIFKKMDTFKLKE